MKNPTTHMNITYDGTLFLAENNAGLKIPMEAHRSASAGNPCGSLVTINPTEIFLSSLGGCASMNIVSVLSQKGVQPESFSVSVDATRSITPPSVFETIHLIFSLKGKMDDKQVTDAIQQTITTLCPISVQVSKVVDITWEHHIEN